jgi:hypothetical protein
MSDSSLARWFATDPRISNPKPVEMHTNATVFIDDGEALGNRATAGQFFLFAHGIELALKSFLHDNGLTLEELKKIGHDLDKLLERCRAKGLACSESDSDSIIDRIAKSLINAGLRYEFYFNMPLIDDVRRVARGILKDTKPTLPPLK